MKKRILVILFALIFAVSLIGFPLTASALNEVSISEDTNLSLWTSGYTVKIMAGSVCDEIKELNDVIDERDKDADAFREEIKKLEEG